jgi:hypothetical protein
VNASLTSAEIEALLEVLHHGLIRIRLAGYAGDLTRAEAIADALHNVPRLILEGDRWGWSIAELRTLFLDDLTQRYPELAVIVQPLDGL